MNNSIKDYNDLPEGSDSPSPQKPGPKQDHQPKIEIVDRNSIKQQTNQQLNIISQPKRYKSLKFLVMLTLCYNLSSFYFGYSMVYFNAIPYEKIQQLFQLKNQEVSTFGIGEGILTGCIPFGALFGSLFSRKIISMFSRRQSFYFGNTLAGIAGVLILFKHWGILIIARIIQGFCVGFFSALTPIMVKEMSPIEVSGSLGAFLSPVIGLGFLLAYLFPYVFEKFQILELETYWRFTFSLTLLTVGLQTFLLRKIFSYQTPKYLLIKNKNEDCVKIIQKIYKEEYRQQIYKEKINDLEINFEKNNEMVEDNRENIQKNKQENQKYKEEELELEVGEQQKIQEKSLNSEKTKYPKDVPLAIFFSFCLPFFQQLSGINIVITFAGELAHGAMPSLQKELPLMINFQKLIFAVIAIFLLDKFGRKTLLVWGTLIVCVSLFLIFVFFITQDNSDGNQKNKWFLVFSFLLYISSFVPTMGPITWLYMPEIVQPTIVPYAAMTHWIMAFIIVTLFPVIRKNSTNPGCPELFLFFSICTLIYFFIALFVMIETKNKDEHQIRQQYRLKWKKIRRIFQRNNK